MPDPLIPWTISGQEPKLPGMRIGMAQINCTLGDFAGNRKKIVEYTQRAHEAGCDLVVFPELSLMGYLPNDLLERTSIIDAQLKEFDKLLKEIPKDIGVIVGLITKSKRKKGKPYHNSAAFCLKGKKPRFFHKELLPTYDVFDEARHIEKGRIADGIFRFKGRRVLMTICEDIWGWNHYSEFHATIVHEWENSCWLFGSRPCSSHNVKDQSPPPFSRDLEN